MDGICGNYDIKVAENELKGNKKTNDSEQSQS